jgi:hypothetical protein
MSAGVDQQRFGGADGAAFNLNFLFFVRIFALRDNNNNKKKREMNESIS